MIASETLRNMSNKEHLELGLKMHLQTDACVALPYRDGKKWYRTGNVVNNGKYLYPTGDLIKHVQPQYDSYISVNQFIPGTNRKSEYVKYICGYYVDLDFGHKDEMPDEVREKYVQLADKKIQDAFEGGVLPLPFMYMATGRGLALHYRFVTMLDATDGELVECYDAGYQCIFQIFREMLENDPDFHGITLEVDTRVKDHSRFCRLPGTMHLGVKKPARLLRYDEVRQEFWGLMEDFGITKDMLSDARKPSAKKKTGKGMGRKLDEACHARRANIEQLHCPTENEIPKAHKIRKDIAKFNLRCLDRYFGEKKWVEGSHRARFLFLIYNNLVILRGTVPAFEQMMEYNSKMQEPLLNYEINNILDFTNEHEESFCTHDDGSFLFNPDTIMSAEWLDITEEVARKCGFYDNRDKEDLRQRHKRLKEYRDMEIDFLYLSGITSVKGIWKQINEEHPEYMCKDKKTVRDALIRLGHLTAGRKNPNEETFPEQKTGGDFFTHNCNYYIYFFSDKGSKAQLTGKPEAEGTERSRLSAERIECQRMYEQEVWEATHAPADEQERALEVMLGDREREGNLKDDEKEFRKQMRIWVRGAAGVGKSVLIQKFYDALSPEGKKKTLCLAFTGRASRKLPFGRTIHSAFRLPCGVIEDPEDCSEMIPYGIDRVIIDEIGMLRLDIFEYVIRMIKNTPHPVQLIVIGDFSQTQAFVNREERDLYMSIYGDRLQCYESAFWRECNFVRIKLSRVRRQADEKFADYLRQVKYGKLYGVFAIWRRASHKFSNDVRVPYICPTRRKVDEINRRMMRQLENKRVIWAKECDANLQRDKAVTLAVDMRVMTTINGINYCNGDIGTVVRIHETSIYVWMDDAHKLVRIRRCKQYVSKDVSYMQFPLVPAYAMTCEKAQGMTFPEINVVPGYFAPGQLYVVLSRCTSNKGIHIEEPFRPEELIVDLRALRIGNEPEIEPEMEEMER